MNNTNTEKHAKFHVINYEKRNRRIPLPNQHNHGKGYDLVTVDASGVKRLIEIKSTQKRRHTHRWLEPKQFKALRNEQNYWIYLVLDVTRTSARIRPVHQSDCPKKATRTSTKHWYKVPESLQWDAKEEPPPPM